MSGYTYGDFFEDLEATTPEEKALADQYEALTRAVVRLARLREERGLTQTQLARKLHVAQPTISKIEHGDNVQVMTLSKYLGAIGAGLRLIAVFDDREDVELGVLKYNVERGLLKGSSSKPRARKGTRSTVGV